MKVCDRCHRVFNEKDARPNVTPPQKLGELYLKSMDRNQSLICDDCKEELGILNLMGFKM